MQKTKSNGQVGPATPAVAASSVDPVPTPAPFDQVKEIITKMGNARYAEGYRRAVLHIARTVGHLDGESRVKMSKTLDELEVELHRAEEAAR
jgi:hypothetical protein